MYFKDLVERTAAAYGASFVGLLLANGFDFTNVSSLRAAGLSAIPAGLTVVYGALAKFVGNPNAAGLTDTRTSV